MKNNKFIESQKQISRAANKVVPSTYAAFAIVLHNRGWTYDDINDLIFDTQVVWNECVHEKDDMLTKCFNETGIDMRLI